MRTRRTEGGVSGFKQKRKTDGNRIDGGDKRAVSRPEKKDASAPGTSMSGGVYLESGFRQTRKAESEMKSEHLWEICSKET